MSIEPDCRRQSVTKSTAFAGAHRSKTTSKLVILGQVTMPARALWSAWTPVLQRAGLFCTRRRRSSSTERTRVDWGLSDPIVRLCFDPCGRLQHVQRATAFDQPFDRHLGWLTSRTGSRFATGNTLKRMHDSPDFHGPARNPWNRRRETVSLGVCFGRILLPVEHAFDEHSYIFKAIWFSEPWQRGICVARLLRVPTHEDDR